MLVGRDGVFQAAARLLARDKPVIVTGESGAGKTAVLDALARASGRPVFAGGGLATLTEEPYLALCRAMGARVPDDGEEAARVIARTVGEGLLVIDDLQWVDAGSLALLPRLVPDVAMLAAIRLPLDGPDGQGAVAAATAMGAELLALPPLMPADAARLVAAAAPHLGTDEVARVVRDGGGNPLLLLAAARGDGGGRALDAAAARLAALTPDARRLAGLLALLGRPLPQTLAGDAVPELVKAELAIERAGRVALTNNVVRDAADAALDVEERAALHLRLAGLVADRLESARHLERAGDRPRASAVALEAAARATGVHERAAALELAARCRDVAGGADAVALRLQAVPALLAAGRAEAARGLLDDLDADDLDSGDPATAAEYRWWAAWVARATGDAPAALELLGDAARLAPSGSPRGGAAKVALAGLRAWPFWDPAAYEAAVLEAASHLPGDGAALDSVLAAGALAASRLEWRDHGIAALGAAATSRRQRDSAYAVLAGGTLLHDGAAEAIRLLDEAALGRDPSPVAALVAVLLAALGGTRPDTAVAMARRRLVSSGEDGDVVAAHLAVALADGGATGAALDVVRAARSRPISPVGEAALAWAEAEAEWWAGRPRRARAAAAITAREALRVPFAALAAVVGAWAALDEGAEIDAAFPGPATPATEAAAVEIGALQTLAAGRAAEAVRLFELAAAGWSGFSRRAELRCRWAAGEAAVRAGDGDTARVVLTAVEKEAGEEGRLPLVAGARASLRAAGVRAAPSGGRGEGALSRRETEVLDLVAEGLTTGEIATRLSVARSTVESQIESAIRKLGARNRRHAAAVRASAGP